MIIDVLFRCVLKTQLYKGYIDMKYINIKVDNFLNITLYTATIFIVNPLISFYIFHNFSNFMTGTLQSYMGGGGGHWR